MGQRSVATVESSPIGTGFAQAVSQIAEVAFPASGAADVPLFTSAPFAFRILRVEAEITTAAPAQSGGLFSAPAGGGAAASGAIDAADLGLNTEAPSGVALTRTVEKGTALYFLRSANTFAGRLRIHYVPT